MPRLDCVIGKYMIHVLRSLSTTGKTVPSCTIDPVAQMWKSLPD